MSVIAILMDNLEGHIIPSFGLAHSLKEKGHEIVYLSVADNRKMIREEGFRFFPLFSDIYPEGFTTRNRSQFQDGSVHPMTEVHLSGIMEGAMDPFFEEVSPDLVIISVFLRMEAILLHYKYNLWPVLLTTYLREEGRTFGEECLHVLLNLPGNTAADMMEFIARRGIRHNSLQELLRPASSFHELVLCPRELGPGDLPANDRVHFTGPFISHRKRSGNATGISNLPAIVKEKKVIYASLGSGAKIYGDAGTAFFNKMIDIMKSALLTEFHLILSVGTGFDVSALGLLAENVTAVNWLDQTEVLTQASLCINHGGLGTIKECIYYGVPMIVFPMTFDQPYNARLIDHHRLGRSADIATLSAPDLESLILSVLNDTGIGNNIRKMQQIFREREISGAHTIVIEHLLGLGAAS